MTKMLSVQAVRLLLCLTGSLSFMTIASGQEPENHPTPLDDITERSVVANHQILTYQPIREADILWEKRLWRIVDVREKMNQSFTAPESPLFKIVFDAAIDGTLPVYSTENDRFTKRLTLDQIESKLFKTDTIMTIDLETGDEMIKIVQNDISWEDVKRFRIKETWFFDANTATLRHRILGIAPLLEVRNENGDFKFEMPLFWVHYPSSRELLARHKAITHMDNWASTTTWEDVFEMRYFSSSVIKESNVRDLRLQDMYAGEELVQKAEAIEDEIFNREQDSWMW
ncbi:MAG: gliding motility protein GldN [Saprospiraceae bacterium]